MTDPRIDEASPDRERNVMPIVERPRAGLPAWILVLGAVLLAALLFGVLEARRNTATAPSAAMRDIDVAALPLAAPVLDIPPAQPPAIEQAGPPLATPTPQPTSAPFPAQPIVQPYVVTQPALPIVPSQPPAPPRSTGSGGATIVVDNSMPRGGANGAGNAVTNAGAAAPTAVSGFAGATERVRASMLANRSVTVPQGTLISAVLETAFDSTRAGFARAIVSRDVAGFDGSRVLIPRGSKLIGEYQSEASPGQKRALIIWSRLIRPDGATIAIGSPATDTLGRGGVRADVNNHFFERFAGAILQSALNVGANFAARSSSTSVVVALPNSQATVGQAGQLATSTTIPPTLSVKAGTSVSVFVARDLDFADVENRQ